MRIYMHIYIYTHIYIYIHRKEKKGLGLNYLVVLIVLKIGRPKGRPVVVVIISNLGKFWISEF